MRPIRSLLIKILFKLLQVPDTISGLAIYEDLQRFEDSKEAAHLTKGMQYAHGIALARNFLDDEYKNYLYYLLMKVQRDNISTIEPFKRDAQTATALFILKHIDDMRKASEKIHSKKGPNSRKMIKEVLKRKHVQQQGRKININ